MSMILIYFYFIICFLILFYTISYIAYQSYHRYHEKRLIRQYINMILGQHQALRQNGYIDRGHRKVLYQKLKKASQLVAFEKALDQLDQQNYLNTNYVEQIELVIKELVLHYQHRDQMQQAYLAYFIAKYAKHKWYDSVIYQKLVSYLDDATVYLRQNVLMATYQQPNPRWIIKVFHYLTEHNLFHHAKLIQDGLLTYPYDREKLIDALWEERDTFHQPIVLGLIGFITYQSDRYKETFYQLLLQDKIDLEVKTRLMRYFKQHHYPKAGSLLESLASDKQDPVRIVATSVLGEYPSERVVEILKKALTDANWYVRRNASQSLLAMNISQTDVSDILNGSDRYAKEMLRYHLLTEEESKYEPIS